MALFQTLVFTLSRIAAAVADGAEVRMKAPGSGSYAPWRSARRRRWQPTGFREGSAPNGSKTCIQSA